MIKVLMTIGATAGLIVFGLQNCEHVPVSFVIGSPTKVRLIFLLLIAGSAGFLFSYIQGLNKEIRLKKEIRRLLEYATETSNRLDVKKRNG